MSEDDIVAFFHRHVVPIAFIFGKTGNSFPYVVTSFVLSVGDDWFLVTAGHCLQKIDDEYKTAGYSIKECYLMDYFGQGATHLQPIPFTYEQTKPLYFPDDRERDYGIIQLSPYYKGLLDSNNVVPLNEQVWKYQPSNPEHYFLIGIPDEYVRHVGKVIEIGTTMNYIERCERPDSLPSTKDPLFYGRIILGPGHRSVAGMSGGPILAIETINGQMKYWVIALQSGWLPDSQIVVGCPTTSLGLALEQAIKGENGA